MRCHILHGLTPPAWAGVAGRRAASLLALLLLLSTSQPAVAERLSIRTFSSADGLGSSFVSHILQDSAGYLWFATRDGLFRWNGYEFAALAQAAVFATPALDRVMQTASGEYFVIDNEGALYSSLPASAGGVETQGRVTFRPRSVRVGGKPVRFTRVYQGPTGVLWGGGHGVLIKGIGTTETAIPLANPGPPLDALVVVHALLEDGAGTLWVGTTRGLFRLLPDGRVCHYTLGPTAAGDIVNALAFDRGGRLWIGHSWLGVVLFSPGPADPSRPSQPLAPRALRGDRPSVALGPGEAVVLTTANGLPGNNVLSLLPASDGQVWVGTGTGLARFDGSAFVRYTRDNGLSDNLVHALMEDADRNLWVATPTGAMRVAAEGFSGYTAQEGLGVDHIVSIGETPDGTLYAIGVDWSVSAFDGRQFRASRLPVPGGSSLMWASQAGYHDRDGRWWALTHQGLYRFKPAPPGGLSALGAPDRVYTARDGLPSAAAFRVYQDRSGAIWVGTRSGDPRDDGLARFDGALAKAASFGLPEGLPPNLAPSAFAEDVRGDLWVGFYQGGLARYRDGRFRLYTASDGFPPGMVTALLVDRGGRLWIASNLAGLSRVDDPSADRPVVRTYSTRDGLASNNVRALAEDRAGRIFAGSVRGVDRLDPGTGRIRHYGAEDGLLGDFVTSAFCDSRGDLWFGTYRGISRLATERERDEAPPPIAVTGLRIAGQRYPVYELGQASVGGVVLEPDQRDIAVDFVSVAGRRARAITYQYSMDGGGESWSLPIRARSVNFVSLPPGSYRFAVRAIAPGGKVSATPATVAFVIQPPIWKRWWVLALGAAGLTGVLFGLYRYRVKRLLEMERLRMGIASDLHDEVATNLSSIAMFGALAKTEAGQASPFLDRITTLATESLEAIREIIWSIDPKPETIAGLLERLRDGMVTACRARGIQLTVLVPSEAIGQNLTPEQRKNLWLMLKESVTNALKHSGGTEISIIVTPVGRRVRLAVRDNGGGPGSTEESSGRGMATMRARAEALGGTVSVTSGPGQGTTVEFDIQLSA